MSLFPNTPLQFQVDNRSTRPPLLTIGMVETGASPPMSHEDLQAYLSAQLDEIRRYQSDQNERYRRQIDMKKAIEEWVEQFGAAYHDFWFQRERPDEDFPWPQA